MDRGEYIPCREDAVQKDLSSIIPYRVKLRIDLQDASGEVKGDFAQVSQLPLSMSCK